MKLVFAGTPEFAAVALRALLHAGHQITLVLTQPDRPSGRGLKLQASPVKQLALQHGIAVAQPRSLRLDGRYAQEASAAQACLVSSQADALVVAAYGLILPQWLLALFGGRRFGCFNIHASLLPRWRGAAPIQRAIQAGDTQTGISIMQMDAGLDTGDVLLQQALAICEQDNSACLHDKLALLGGRLMLQALALAQQGALQRVPQSDQGISYAVKINKQEAPIDWTQTAKQICQQVRAFNPAPVANTLCQGEVLKIWAAQPAAFADAVGSAWTTPEPHLAGQIVQVSASGICVAAKDSLLRLTELQRPGGKRLSAADLLRGWRLEPGLVLGK